MNLSTIRLGIALLLLALASRAQGQQIVHFTDGWQSNPIGTALIQLDLDAEGTTSEQEFLDLLRARRWDLVIVRRYSPLGPSVRNFVRAELEAHLDRGGALMFSIAQLDEMPDFWPLLGIEGARDLVLPLEDIISSSNGSPFPVPPHPAFSSHARWDLADELVGPDYGDAITPSSQSYSIAQYERGGPAAITVGRAGRVIVNGQEWDNWIITRGVDLATDQIRWLLSCPADLDGDGSLTLFDFLEFQSLFDAGDPGADVFFDAKLDVFDFLEFFNQFQAGC